MSDREKPERGWRSFITDMIASGESVLAFTDGMNVEEFSFQGTHARRTESNVTRSKDRSRT